MNNYENMYGDHIAELIESCNDSQTAQMKVLAYSGHYVAALNDRMTELSNVRMTELTAELSNVSEAIRCTAAEIQKLKRSLDNVEAKLNKIERNQR